jgi:protein-L-isoaspartate(D-aspartate) O-methyltransferase
VSFVYEARRQPMVLVSLKQMYPGHVKQTALPLGGCSRTKRIMHTHMRMKFAFSLILVISLSPLNVGADSQETAFADKRRQMVEAQIKARGIKDLRVLEAILKVKRHLFVPPDIRHLAYEDHPLPIGEGQTISQPYIVALMTELLALRGKEKVLEIGTGSGYQAAILAELANEVYTIEILEPLARQSEGLLKNLGYKNIKVKFGDGFLGWPEFAPFDGIIVTCAPAKIPPPLLEQLAESGRLVIPVGVYWQELKLVRKINGRIKEADIAPVRFVPMLREK